MTTDPDASRKRLRVLWKVRARALAELAKRHPDEYRDIRAKEVEKMGETPIRPTQGRPPTTPKE